MKVAAACLLALGLASCVGYKSSRRMKPEIEGPPEAWSGVRRIAVLPADNWTLDAGVEYITWYRALIHELLREKGYEVTPLVDVNRFFLKNKFSLAGEAGMYTSGELASALRADAVLYWAITAEAPRLAFSLEKADGTPLWSTGEVALGLTHVAQIGGRFNASDGGIALALGEILRALPRRAP